MEELCCKWQNIYRECHSPHTQKAAGATVYFRQRPKTVLFLLTFLLTIIASVFLAIAHVYTPAIAFYAISIASSLLALTFNAAEFRKEQSRRFSRTAEEIEKSIATLIHEIQIEQNNMPFLIDELKLAISEREKRKIRATGKVFQLLLAGLGVGLLMLGFNMLANGILNSAVVLALLSPLILVPATLVAGPLWDFFDNCFSSASLDSLKHFYDALLIYELRHPTQS